MISTYNKKLAIFLSALLALLSISVVALSGFFRPVRLKAHADELSDVINSKFRIDGTKTNFLQGNNDVMFSSFVELDMHLVSEDDNTGGLVTFAAEPASVITPEDYEYYTMTFALGLKNTELYLLRDGAISEFYFDFYRLNEDEKGVASGCTLLSRAMFYANRYKYLPQHKDEYVKYRYTAFAKKVYVFSNAQFGIDPSQKFSDKKQDLIGELLGEKNNGWTVECGDYCSENAYFNGLDWQNMGGTPTILYKIKVTDPDTKYFCRFNYKVADWAFDNGFMGLGSKYYEKQVVFGGSPTNNAATNGGTVQSPAASPASVLKDYRTSGILNEKFNNKQIERANEILDGVTYKTVTVQRLVEIPGTPFATTKRDVVRVPVRSDGLFYETVCAALGEKSLAVLESYPKSMLKLTEDGTYKVDYNAAAWFQATNADGKKLNMFLDINSSYFDYYNTQTINTATDGKNNAIMSPGMLEFFLNEIKKKYPVLEGYGNQNLYGYWGFFAIPGTYTLDDAFKALFGVATQYEGVASYFRYDCQITSAAYNRLLSDYDYNWLAKAWNGAGSLVDGFDATYYMIYMDKSGRGAVSDNGSTDPDNTGGLTVNKAQELVSGVVDFFKGLVGNPAIWIVVVVVVGIIVFSDLGGKGGKKRK